MTVRLFLREFLMRSEVTYQEISSEVRRKVLQSGRHKVGEGDKPVKSGEPSGFAVPYGGITVGADSPSHYDYSSAPTDNPKHGSPDFTRFRSTASLILHALEHPFAPIPFDQAPAVDLVFWTLYLLEARFGQISPEVRSHIQQLPLAQLEELGEALLDFDSMQDLTDWLQA